MGMFQDVLGLLKRMPPPLARLSLFLDRSVALRALGPCHAVCVSLPWDCAQPKDGDSCPYETG